MAQQPHSTSQSATASRRDDGPTFRAAWIAAVVVMIEAAIYAIAIRYNPFVLLSIVCTLVFGTAIGVEVSRAWQSRARALRLAAALLLAVLGLWTHWLIWIALTVEHGVRIAGHLALSGPMEWVRFLDRLAHSRDLVLLRRNGMFGSPASALQLTGIWLGEALLVFVTAVSMGMAVPTYHRWAVEMWSTGLSFDALREALRRGDVALLRAQVWHDAMMRPPSHPVWQSVEFGFDDEHSAISAVMIDHRPDDAHGEQQKRTLLVDGLSLTRRDYRALVKHLSDSRVIKD
jgi:hypothetical protein